MIIEYLMIPCLNIRSDQSLRSLHRECKRDPRINDDARMMGSHESRDNKTLVKAGAQKDA